MARSVGLELDPWQELALEAGLVRRDDSRWAAREVALVVPRQNGKGAVLEARELAGLFLFGERLILHSAHEFKTSQEAFQRLLGWIDNTDWLRKRVARVRTSHGEEGIELVDGRRCRFVARSGGSGRGFTADTIILDEAFALQDAHMAALMPTLSARTVKANPQVWYTSSAPLSASVVLHRIRERGRVAAPGLGYLEWSAPDDADLDDLAAVAQANPGLGIRIAADFVMETERGSMSDETFARERLGIAPTLGLVESVWPVGAWDACCDPALAPDVGLVVGVDVHPDRVSAAVGVADALGRVELVDAQPGVGWVVERAVGLASKHNARVAVQSTGPAGALIPDLERAGVRVVPVTQGDVRAACGAFYDAVAARQRFIRWHDVLNRAAGSAIRKDSGDGWVFDRRAGADVSPLYAVLLARWAATSQTTITPTVIDLNDYLEGDDD